MLMDFQHQDANRRQVERLRKVARKYRHEWLHYLAQQRQLAEFALTGIKFALAIALGVVVGIGFHIANLNW
jgi:hypothetical protein